MLDTRFESTLGKRTIYPTNPTAALFDAIEEHNLAGLRDALNDSQVNVNASINNFLPQSHKYRNSGLTPLSLSIENESSTEFIKVLLEHGANPNVYAPLISNPSSTFTPLHLAILKNRQDVEELLLQNGADAFLWTKDIDDTDDVEGGLNCFHLAAKYETDTSIMETLWFFHVGSEAIQKLLTSPDENGSKITPLFYAIERGTATLVKFILEKGGSAAFDSDLDYTPLQFGLVRSEFSPKMLQVLFDHRDKLLRSWYTNPETHSFKEYLNWSDEIDYGSMSAIEHSIQGFKEVQNEQKKQDRFECFKMLYDEGADLVAEFCDPYQFTQNLESMIEFVQKQSTPQNINIYLLNRELYGACSGNSINANWLDENKISEKLKLLQEWYPEETRQENQIPP